MSTCVGRLEPNSGLQLDEQSNEEKGISPSIVKRERERARERMKQEEVNFHNE